MEFNVKIDLPSGKVTRISSFFGIPKEAFEPITGTEKVASEDLAAAINYLVRRGLVAIKSERNKTVELLKSLPEEAKKMLIFTMGGFTTEELEARSFPECVILAELRFNCTLIFEKNDHQFTVKKVALD